MVRRTAEPPVPKSSAKEPCLACGEETAVGSVFYSDRLAVTHDDSLSAYLCSLCRARVRSSGRGRRLTDEEIRNAVANGSAAALAWGNAGAPPGI
jgi:hypothetical protein